MTVPTPRERQNWIGDPALESQLRAGIDDGSLSHGWLLSGPPGIGRATLAYRIARARLAPKALSDNAGLAVDPTIQGVRLIAAGSHPDLFVAEREWDDKKERLTPEIPVETIRRMGEFLSHTPAFGGWRVIIVDTVDDLNRNAANAILKALEEPPPKTLLLLLTTAPGRVLPTIRSRCRRVALRPQGAESVAGFLRAEGYGDDAGVVAAAAGGRPGFALSLAAGEGAEAAAALEGFLKSVRDPAKLNAVIQSLTGKAGDPRWTHFRPMLAEAMHAAAREIAVSGAAKGPFAGADPASLLTAADDVSVFLERGDALNLDRTQMLHRARRVLSRIAGPDALHRPA